METPFPQCYFQTIHVTSSLRLRQRPLGRKNRINVDEERLSDLRFADDVALPTETIEDREHQSNAVNEESLEVGIKIHKG